MTLEQTAFPFAERTWWVVPRCDPRARSLADRHYSRQTPGEREFMPNGRTLVMITEDAGAVWGVCENLDRNGILRWRCTIFRRESGPRASDLIREATHLTKDYWIRHYGGRPLAYLTTEIDPRKVRHKRDPGRCFKKAGWTVWGTTSHGLLVLIAPGEAQAPPYECVP